jgi:hypothetical protein
MSINGIAPRSPEKTFWTTFAGEMLSHVLGTDKQPRSRAG